VPPRAEFFDVLRRARKLVLEIKPLSVIFRTIMPNYAKNDLSATKSAQMASRSQSIRDDLERRYGAVLQPQEVAQVLNIKSRSSLDRWRRAAEEDGLKVLRLPGRGSWHVVAHDLADWLSYRAEADNRDAVTNRK